jgi:hypothetical protein
MKIEGNNYNCILCLVQREENKQQLSNMHFFRTMRRSTSLSFMKKAIV